MGPLCPEGKLKCFEIPIVTADDSCLLSETDLPYCDSILGESNQTSL